MSDTTIAWYNGQNEKTIKSLLDHTHINLDYVIHNDPEQTKSGFYNAAIEYANTEYICFLDGIIKFKENWLQSLQSIITHNQIAVPITHDLDIDWWISKPKFIKNTTFKWDLNLYETRKDKHPSLLPYCYLTKLAWIKQIGGFDQFRENGQEEIDITLRNYCSGGKIVSTKDSIISAPINQKANSAENKKRILDTWFSKYNKTYSNIAPYLNDVKYPHKLKPLQNHIESIESFLTYQTPELFTTIDFINKHVGSEIVILINDVDIPERYFMNTEIIIAVGSIANSYDCNYVYVNDITTLEAIREKYQEQFLIVPEMLKNSGLAPDIESSELLSRANILDCVPVGNQYNGFSPIISYDDSTLVAIQVAKLMGAKTIVVVGSDLNSNDFNILASQLKHFGTNLLRLNQI